MQHITQKHAFISPKSHLIRKVQVEVVPHVSLPPPAAYSRFSTITNAVVRACAWLFGTSLGERGNVCVCVFLV